MYDKTSHVIELLKTQETFVIFLGIWIISRNFQLPAWHIVYRIIPLYTENTHCIWLRGGGGISDRNLPTVQNISCNISYSLSTDSNASPDLLYHGNIKRRQTNSLTNPNNSLDPFTCIVRIIFLVPDLLE